MCSLLQPAVLVWHCIAYRQHVDKRIICDTTYDQSLLLKHAFWENLEPDGGRPFGPAQHNVIQHKPFDIFEEDQLFTAEMLCHM